MSYKALDSLFPSIGGASFLATFWPSREHVEHGSLDRLDNLANARDALSIPGIFSSCPTDVRLWHHSPREGLVDLRQVPPDNAAALFETGNFTVVLDAVEHWIPAVKTLLDSLAEDIGTPMHGVSCNAFVSPAGASSPMHFDQQEVCILQLHGKKQWTTAPNRDIQFPTKSYFGGGYLHPELAAVISDEPKPDGSEASTHTLEAGSSLFLPRGHWHQGKTVADSLALTLTFASKTWRDLCIEALGLHLLKHEDWRRPASRASMPAIASSWPGSDELNSLLSASLLANCEDFGLTLYSLEFCVRQHVTIKWAEDNSLHAYSDSSGESVKVTLPHYLKELVAWLGGRGQESFSLLHASDSSSRASADDTANLLSILIESQMMVWRPLGVSHWHNTWS